VRTGVTYQDVIDEYLVSVKKYIKDIPHPLLVAFYGEFDGLNEDVVRARQQEIYNMYNISLSDESLAIELALHDEAEVIFKPENYSVFPDGRVILVTRGGSYLLTHVKELGKTREEIENILSNWIYAIVKRSKVKTKGFASSITTARVVEFEPLTMNYEFDAAKKILNDYDLLPIEALLLANGIIPDGKTIRLFLPRFIPLLNYNGMPIHVMQLTNTDSGKSHFAARLEFAFNFTTFSEMPSAAKLIYDARNYTKGAVFTSEGIVIDEVDKIKKERFDEVYQPLNTGLENGIWRRGVQTSKGVRLEGYRLIPFLLFGNIIQGEDPLFKYVKNPRRLVNDMFDNLARFSTYSFIERFAVVDVVYERIPITKYVVFKDGVAGCMRDSVYRALVKTTQDEIRVKPTNPNVNVQGRLKRHTDALFNVVSALTGVEPDEDVIAKIVLGELSIDALFTKTDVGEEVKEVVYDVSPLSDV